MIIGISECKPPVLLEEVFSCLSAEVSKLVSSGIEILGAIVRIVTLPLVIHTHSQNQ